MIEFQDALKKSRAYNLIKHDIDTGNLSHAYMVISPDVFAVQNLFRLIACAVYCKDACTTCPVCKKVLNGNHADVKFINEDGKKIKVEDVAALIEDTETKPFESDNKLYFVNSADKMNPKQVAETPGRTAKSREHISGSRQRKRDSGHGEVENEKNNP